MNGARQPGFKMDRTTAIGHGGDQKPQGSNHRQGSGGLSETMVMNGNDHGKLVIDVRSEGVVSLKSATSNRQN